MKFENTVYRLACTFALSLMSLTGLAHNEHPLGRQPIEWQGGQHILRTIALNFDFHGGDNFITEFVRFLADNKKWWLAPIIIALLIVTGLVLLGGTSAAPFIYTLF